VWTLEIQCPYCPEKHRHGGGDGAEPLVDGARVPQCIEVFYRQHLIFDSRVVRHLPNYQLAPAHAAVDWEQERAYASVLLEEAEMNVEDEFGDPRWEAFDQKIREAYGTVTKAEEDGKQGRNRAYLAAWQAKQEDSR
jgi:hypothetical protein